MGTEPRTEGHASEDLSGARAGAALPALEAVDVTRVYRTGTVEVRAVEGVSLSVTRGDMVCIMGKSGSGKSTLLRQLGLLDQPTAGTIWIGGRDVTRLSGARRSALRLEKLGYVFQEYALLPELTAEENVYLPAHMRGEPRSRCQARARELLELVELGDRAKHRPKELSGGEQQRVAIARALVNRPDILFADEPTASLDTASAHTVMEALQDLNQQFGVTVVFVSHDPDDRRYAANLLFLRDGHVVEPYF